MPSTSGYQRPIITEEDAVIALPRVIPRTKATPIPEPGIFDEPTYCIKINKSWMAHLSGVVAALDQPDTWIGTEEKIFATRNDIREWLIAIYAGTFCQPGTSCHDLQTSNPNIVFFPQDPYTQPDYVPPGYGSTPFDVIQNEDFSAIGLHTGDVVMFFDSVPSIEAIVDTGFPSITVHVEGKVEVELHLLNVPQGGLGLVTVDDDPLKTTIITMQSMSITELSTIIDILASLIGSFPAVELFAESIMEFKFDTDGPHKIEVRLFPFVEVGDESLINLGMGGGIRKVTVCTISDTEGCDCMDEECCNKIITRQDEQLKRFDRIISLIEGGFKIVPLGDGLPPDAISFGECAPDKYDSDDGDEGDDIALRTAALCYVIHCYVAEILYKACFQMGLPEIFLNSIFPEHATMPDALHRIKVEYPTQIPLLALIEDIALNGAFSDLVACQMLIALRGQLNVFSVFKDSVSIFGLVGSITIPISGLVHASNQNPANWKVFGEALDQAMEMETEVDAYTCPCVLDCSEPLDLVIFDGHGTLELVEGYTDLYHFTGEAAVDGEGGVWVKDALGRCLSVWNSSVVELPTQAVLYHHVIGCCGTESTTGLLGGFAGLTEDTTFFTQFYWDQQTGPVDTYYHVKCIDECPEE